MHWAIRITTTKWFKLQYNFRHDQYRLVNVGSYKVKHESLEFRKKSSAIYLNSADKKGDCHFRRFEYWGIGSYFMLHYVGDDTLYQGFNHRNRMNDDSKPFVRSAPHVKDKVNAITFDVVLCYS